MFSERLRRWCGTDGFALSQIFAALFLITSIERLDKQLLTNIQQACEPHVYFVYKVLFPFARAHLREFLAEHSDSEQVRQDFARLRDQHTEDETAGVGPPPLLKPPAELDSTMRYVNWLMDRDSKAADLKSLQGKI